MVLNGNVKQAHETRTGKTLLVFSLSTLLLHKVICQFDQMINYISTDFRQLMS